MSGFKIQIPKQCHENWDRMSPSQGGRFCDSCQKKVFDFTLSSDRAIISVLSQNQNACGRFTASQLDRELTLPKEKSSAFAVAASGILGMLSAASAFAQEKDKPGTVIIAEDQNLQSEFGDTKIILGDTILSAKNPKIIKVKGVVYDEIGPLPGAAVQVMETGAKVMADIDGKFSIEAHEGQNLEFTFVGMLAKIVPASPSNVYNITLCNSEQILAGEIVVTRRPNFFKRLWYRLTRKGKKKAPIKESFLIISSQRISSYSGRTPVLFGSICF